MKPYEQLVRYWRADGMTVVSGASEESLVRFEAQYGVTLSADPDFREYLLSVNGMAQIGGQDCDQNGFAFWPLSRIKSLPEECLERKVEVPRLRFCGLHAVVMGLRYRDFTKPKGKDLAVWNKGSTDNR